MMGPATRERQVVRFRVVRERPIDWHTRSVRMMGTTLTLVGGAVGLDAAAVEGRFDAVVAELTSLAACWTRFEADSDLERLNRATGHTVAVDPRLGVAIAAALAARERSQGLVDPTLHGAITAAGYDATITRLDRVPASEVAAYAARHAAHAARPRTPQTAVAVAADRRSVTRDPGVRLDLGGSAKGFAADLAARHLRDLDRWVVDLGGDVRFGGRRRDLPQEVRVDHPVDESTIATMRLDRGAVATSTIARRAWRDRDGSIAHHLLDPSSGEPAWTGLLQATARARTALEAELLAKVSLLRGPVHGAATLRARHGGVLVHADGTIQEVTPR